MAAPSLPKSPPNIPTEGDDSPTKEATIPGLIQFTAAERPSSLPHHPSIENETPMSRSREEMSPTEDSLSARHRADEVMKAIVPIDRSKMWEIAVERINWVMVTLSPIAEVRTMLFFLSPTELTSTQLFPLAKMVHSLLSVIPKVRPFASFQTRCSCHVRLDGRHSCNSINMTTTSKRCSRPCMTHLISHIMKTL